MDNELFDILSYDESIVSDKINQFSLHQNKTKHLRNNQFPGTSNISRLNERPNNVHHYPTKKESNSIAKTLITTLTNISDKLDNKKEHFTVKKTCGCSDSLFSDDRFILFLLFLFVIYIYIQHNSMMKINEQLFLLNANLNKNTTK